MITDVKFNYRTGLIEVTLSSDTDLNVGDNIMLKDIISHPLQFDIKDPSNITDYDPRWDANLPSVTIFQV